MLRGQVVNRLCSNLHNNLLSGASSHSDSQRVFFVGIRSVPNKQLAAVSPEMACLHLTDASRDQPFRRFISRDASQYAIGQSVSAGGTVAAIDVTTGAVIVKSSTPVDSAQKLRDEDAAPVAVPVRCVPRSPHCTPLNLLCCKGSRTCCFTQLAKRVAYSHQLVGSRLCRSRSIHRTLVFSSHSSQPIR